MRVRFTPEQARLLAALPEERRDAFVAGCSARELLLIDAAFELWAHEGQLEPVGETWRTWLMLAGRGFGKTRAGAEWIHRLASRGRYRIALVGATIDEARRIMVEGMSGLLSIARRERVPVSWEPSNRTLRWKSGSEAVLFSGDSPDGLRGPEHHFAWCDELAKWREAEESWSNMQLGLRASERSRVLVTTTPKGGALLQRLREDPLTVTTGGRTMDNISLPRSFISAMAAAYGGTRLGRQELNGELLVEAEGTLFPQVLLDAARGVAPERFDRVVVAVDPPASELGDACGIVVAGRVGGMIWVLADASVERTRPEGWARVVAAAAKEWGASHVVAEANQGGAMVESVLKAADARLRVKLVHASRGKVARAEPVAVRMETGKVRLASGFPALEAELRGLAVGGKYDGPGRSPDRADAMVWAVTELSETRSGLPRVRAL